MRLEGGTIRCARMVHLVQGHSAVLFTPGKALVAHVLPNPPLPMSCHAPGPVVRSRSHTWPQILHCWEQESQESVGHLPWLERKCPIASPNYLSLRLQQCYSNTSFGPKRIHLVSFLLIAACCFVINVL